MLQVNWCITIQNNSRTETIHKISYNIYDQYEGKCAQCRALSCKCEINCGVTVMRLKVHLILHLLLCGRGFFHVFSINDKGFEHRGTSSNSWCSFRSPKDAGLTWLKMALLGSGYHLQHLSTRACIPFLYHITFSCALRSITSYPAYKCPQFRNKCWIPQHWGSALSILVTG